MGLHLDAMLTMPLQHGLVKEDSPRILFGAHLRGLVCTKQ